MLILLLAATLLAIRDVTSEQAAFARLLLLGGAISVALLALLLGFVYVLLRRADAGVVARQAELRESEARLAQLAEQSGTVAWEVDAQGLFTYVSHVSEAIWGYRPGELVGRMHFYDLCPEAEREALKRDALAVFARGEPFRNLVNPTQAKDGRRVWVSTNGIALLNADGTRGGYRGSDTDITERVQAEQQVKALLAESDTARQALLGMLEDETRTKANLSRLAMAIEQAVEAVVITDPAGTIQYVNPAFEAVTGYGRDEAIGQNSRILKSGQQDEAFYRRLWETILSGKTWSGSFVNRKKGGALYTEEATISPVLSSAGQIANFVAVKRDITEHLHVAAQLRHAQKLESVGRLAGGVAHDFNNLLMGIMNYVELCRDELPPEHATRRYLDEIAADAQRTAGITQQLLAFARKQAIAPRTLDLNEALAGMLKMLQRLMGEDIDLAWSPGAGLWPVKIDPGQLDQILANLCVNARDAIAGVGRVVIETANTHLESASGTEPIAAAPGEYVLLTVSDSGCGISEEALAYIFEPFFTTKPVGRGTGLGLATVYGIIEQNHGHIAVHSEPGAGTKFSIYLPRAVAAANTEELTVSPQELPHGTETILLVEDEKSVRVTAHRFLELLGYTVWVAETPEEALRLETAHAGSIHLLITDVIMPGMNGRDLAGLLSQQHPGLKCLFMSGYPADVIMDRGTLDADVHFIPKPFTRNALAHRVRDVLERA